MENTWIVKSLQMSLAHFPYSFEGGQKRGHYILRLAINAARFPRVLNIFLGYLIVEKSAVQFSALLTIQCELSEETLAVVK